MDRRCQRADLSRRGVRLSRPCTGKVTGVVELVHADADLCLFKRSGGSLRNRATSPYTAMSCRVAVFALALQRRPHQS
jgi:hypothetical protein